jgi:hypothetical protein
MDRHNKKSKTNYRQALEENTLMQKSKQTTNEVIIIIIILLKHRSYLELKNV